MPMKVSIENCGRDVEEERYSATWGLRDRKPKLTLSQGPGATWSSQKTAMLDSNIYLSRSQATAKRFDLHNSTALAIGRELHSTVWNGLGN